MWGKMTDYNKNELNHNEFDERFENVELCSKCKTFKIDKFSSKYSNLCTNCREEQLKVKIPFKHLITLLILVVISSFAIFLSIGSVNRYVHLLRAEKQTKNKEYLFAYQNYSAIVEDYSFNEKIVIKTVRSALDAQYFYDAAYYYDEYIAGVLFNDSDFKETEYLFKKINTYVKTYGAIEELFKNNENESDPEIYLENINNQLARMEDNLSLNKTLIYYYLSNFSQTIEDAKRYMKLSTKVDKQFTFTISYYGNLLRRYGEFDEARKTYEYGLSLNANDANSLAGLGKLELLIGDKVKGLELIEKAYNIEPYYTYMPESYIIALVENGKLEKAEEVKNNAKENDYEFDYELEMYLNSEITLWDYYVESEIN